MKFNKRECKVLHLGRNKPMRQYRLRADWLEGNFAGKGLGFLGKKELNMSQQYAFVAKPTACWATLGRVLTAGQGR